MPDVNLMPQVVPIEDLPAEFRQAVPTGHASIDAYAQQLEDERGLPKGSLTGARIEGKDPLMVLLSAANDLTKQKAKREADYAAFKQTAQPEPSFMAGVGKAPSDWYHGVRQAFGAEGTADADERRRLDAPLMNSNSGFYGEALGQGLMGYLASRGLSAAGEGLSGPAVRASAGNPLGISGSTARTLTNPYSNAALAGGAAGASQPVESGGSRAAQAILGSIVSPLGQLAGQGLIGAGRAASAYSSDTVKRLAQFAEDHGINLRAADISDNPITRGIQHVLDYAPFSGGHAQREGAQKAFNSSLAKTMGEDTGDLTQALQQAKPRLNSTYEDLFSRNQAEVDPTKHGQALVDAWKKFQANDTSPWTDFKRPGMDPWQQKSTSQTLDDYLTNLVAGTNAKQNPATGKFEMPGELYKQFRSEARENAQAATKRGDNNLAKFYTTVKEQLDDSIRKSAKMSPEDAALLKKSDKEWGNMRTLENLAPKDASGDVDFKKLANVLTKKDANSVYNRNAFVYGSGDQELPDLARVATQFLGRGLPPTKMSSYAQKGIAAAPYALGVPAVSYGLYSSNIHDPHPVLDTLGELGGLALLSRLGGSAANSKWFARGAAPWLQRATEPAAGLLSQAPLGWLGAEERKAPLTFEDGLRP